MLVSDLNINLQSFLTQQGSVKKPFRLIATIRETDPVYGVSTWNHIFIYNDSSYFGIREKENHVVCKISNEECIEILNK